MDPSHVEVDGYIPRNAESERGVGSRGSAKMRTDLERESLVQQWTAALRLDRLPAISVKDLAMREALLAYLHGLPVSAVLTAHAACEIGLAELLAHHTLVKTVPSMIEEPHRAAEVWAAADKAARGPSRIKVLLDQLDQVGCWIPRRLYPSLDLLSQHRQSLAHYRPIYKQGTLRIKGSRESGFEGSFESSPFLNPELLESYAEQAIQTMVVVRNMPDFSFTPGHPPPDDWEPPPIVFDPDPTKASPTKASGDTPPGPTTG